MADITETGEIVIVGALTETGEHVRSHVTAGGRLTTFRIIAGQLFTRSIAARSIHAGHLTRIVEASRALDTILTTALSITALKSSPAILYLEQMRAGIVDFAGRVTGIKGHKR